MKTSTEFEYEGDLARICFQIIMNTFIVSGSVSRSPEGTNEGAILTVFSKVVLIYCRLGLVKNIFQYVLYLLGLINMVCK